MCVPQLFFLNRRASFHKNMDVEWKDWTSLSNPWKLVWNNEKDNALSSWKVEETHLGLKLMKSHEMTTKSSPIFVNRSFCLDYNLLP